VEVKKKVENEEGDKNIESVDLTKVDLNKLKNNKISANRDVDISTKLE
jgi:hypothetical protein